MFDDVVLLIKGGRSVYAGPTKSVLPYFDKQGFHCAPDMNPGDFLMDCISGRLLPCDGYRVLSVDEMAQKWYDSYQQNLEQIATAFRLKSGKYRKRKQTGFWCHLRLYTIRSFQLLMRSPVTQFLDFALVATAGLGLGLLFHSRSIDDTPSIFLLTSMTIGMTTMLSTVRLLGNERTVYHREVDMGMDPFAYFLGKNVAFSYMHLLTPLAFLATFYALVTPRAPFVELYFILYAATLATSGIAQAVSVVFNERNMQLAGVVIILLLNMVGGTNPTICDLNDMSVIAVLTNSSYARFLIDALVVAELKYWPPVYKYIVADLKKHYCYDKYGMGWNITALIVIGIVTRLIAFMALITIVPNRMQSLRNVVRLSAVLGVGILIAGVTIGAVIGIAYFILTKTS